MDPLVSERLLKFGDQKMMQFYVDACKEHMKYPSLTVAEVMCVFATLPLHEDRDRALWRLCHRQDAPKLQSVKDRMQAPEPSNNFTYRQFNAPGPARARHEASVHQRLTRSRNPRDDLRGRMKNRPINSRTPFINIVDKKYFICGDSQMVRLAGTLDFPIASDAYKVRHAGKYCFSGARVTNVIDMIKEVDGSSPGPRLAVLVGVNDVVKDGDLNKGITHYKTLLRILGTKCEEAIVMTLPPVLKVGGSTAKNIALFNKSMQQTASRYPNIKVVNVYEVFDDKAELFERDGLHLNKTGHMKLLELLQHQSTNNKNMDTTEELIHF